MKSYRARLLLLLFIFLHKISYAADPNLHGHWAFDESSGTTAYDLAGNHNGTVYEATWTPDSQYGYGNALNFNGSAYVNIGSIGITEDWTVSFWAKLSDNTGTAYYPIGLGNSNSGIAMGGMSSAITQHIVLYDGNSPLKSLTTVDTGNWYHIAVTKSATTYSLYVNGICEKTGALNDIDLTNFKIGARPDLFGYFKGIIDDVGIWNCALAAGDINDPNPGTINYVRLNGVSGPNFGAASNPNPSHMQTNVQVNADLGWRAGENAADVNGHRIYLSKYFNDINEGTAEYVVLTESNYSPANLDYSTTYYWRVDEVNDPCVWQGRVWKFSTSFGVIDPNFVSHWRLDKGNGAVAYDSIGHNNGIIYGATWTSDGQFGNALNFDGNDVVDIGNIGVAGDWTVCFWAKSSNNTGPAYYPIGLGNPNSGIAMGGTSSSITQHIVVYDGSNKLKSTTKIKVGQWYHIAVTRSGTTYSIYVNGVLEKTGALNGISLTNFKVGVRPDWLGFFKGTIDDVGVWNRVLDGGDVNDPNPGTINYVRINGVSSPGYGVAWNPFPADHQTSVPKDVTLRWRAAVGTAEVNEYRLYFSTDFDGVHNGTIGYVSVTESNYSPGILDANTTYYWRIDEIIGSNVWQGLVWRFTTHSGAASVPYPVNNANSVSSNVVLDWIPGYYTADINGHELYFGTNSNDVKRGRCELVTDMNDDGQVNIADLVILCEQWLAYDEGSVPQADLDGDRNINLTDFALMADEWYGAVVYKGRQTNDWYDPCNLEYGITYFWRVDEVNEPNIWPGEVWSFTTGIDEPVLTNAPTFQIIPAYDGSGQAMHPSILYFPDGWNGYKYWLGMTPFPYSNSSKENPSILASDDGSSWEVPPGLTNPLIFAPSGGGYNADPELVYNDDTNELWLYFLRYFSNTNETKMGLMKSSDGISWTEPNYLITWNNYIQDNDRSYAIIKQGANWYYWAENRDAIYEIFYRYSTDGVNWSEPQNANFSPAPEVLPWHLDVIYVPSKSEYWMLISAPGGEGGNLYLAKSRDRLNWTPGLNEILSPSSSGWDNYMLYRSTLLYDDAGQLLRVWYSARNTWGEWHTGYTETEY